MLLHSIAFLFFFFVGAFATFQIPAPPIVRIPEYTAFGLRNTTNKGTETNLYLGLPYVKPPERFEKAEPLKPSLLKVVNAQSWPKACHQMNDVGNATEVSEDCLYFNVFTPSTISLKLRPVFIFIHGGGYFAGYTQAYGYEYFVDNFVSQDVVVVTLQYRVAHFGYLATRDHVINGNFGLFDQLAALKFIKKSIRAFGGDPNRITLGGHSAGSTSTHALSWHPETRNIFNQEIHVAGSNYALWGIASESNFNHSELISNAVGCGQSDSNAKKACLKQVDFRRFWEVRQELNLTDLVPDKIDALYWSPNFDNDFFQGKTMDQLQAAAPKRKALYGLDINEALHHTLITDNPITRPYAIARGGYTYENRAAATAEKNREFVLQFLVDLKFNSTTKEAIINRVFEFYQIGMGPNASDPNHFFYKLTELNSIIIKTAIGTEIDAKYNLGWRDQYLYQNDYVRPQDLNLIGDAPGHGYFLLYLCGLNIYTNNGISHTTEDNLVQNNIAQVFNTFIKGNPPSSNGIPIPKVNAASIPYMLVDTSVTIGTNDIKPAVDFWKQLAADYQYDFLRQINL